LGHYKSSQGSGPSQHRTETDLIKQGENYYVIFVGFRKVIDIVSPSRRTMPKLVSNFYINKLLPYF
jgi:hypothetical protein